MERDVTFAVDGMLARLGKYLRALGYDTLSAPLFGDALFHRAEAEGRIVVTARSAVPGDFGGRVLLVRGEPVERQIAGIFAALNITPSRESVLTRCLECNAVTRDVPLEEVRDRVPEGIREKVSSYRICPSCNRVYWWGSHADRIVERLEESGVFG
ncbi:MAG: hypothetical protein HY770_03955 [Chitinivibrionia bacterium]|nr:hypothetical protein [Chitinivibrionia bacterium]